MKRPKATPTLTLTLHESETSFPDPKFLISDPDPQIENQEFRIGSFCELETVKKSQFWSIHGLKSSAFEIFLLLCKKL